MKLRKFLSMLVCGALLLLPLSACGGGESSASSAPGVSQSQSQPDLSSGDLSQGEAPSGLPRLMVLSGPTGVGAAKLMADDQQAAAGDRLLASAQVAAANDEVTAALLNVEEPVDIAAIATNVAANLYNKSQGAIQVLAVNTLGVLYILEKGESVQSVADLAGRTIYATGQGANPEYILNYLLTQNGLDPERDVDIQWMTAQEVSARMASSSDGVCMLPVPAATALMLQDTGVREALDLSAEWDEVSGSPLVMGCVVARRAYVEEHPEQVEAFLTAYEQSIAYMSDPDNLEQGAELVAELNITASAGVAQAAIPQCNLTYLEGTQMRQALQSYYEVLYTADPAAIGGANPDDAFYYIP